MTRAQRGKLRHAGQEKQEGLTKDQEKESKYAKKERKREKGREEKGRSEGKVTCESSITIKVDRILCM